MVKKLKENPHFREIYQALLIVLLENINHEARKLSTDLATPSKKTTVVTTEQNTLDSKLDNETISTESSRYTMEQEASGAVINNFIHTYRFKKKFQNNPYDTYMALLDNDEEGKAILSRIMYGRRAAELITRKKYDMKNPYVPQSIGYNRFAAAFDKGINPEVRKALCREFNIPETSYIVPVVDLETIKIEDYLRQHNLNFTLKKIPGRSIALIYSNYPISYYQIEKLIHTGLTASSWDVAQNVSIKSTTPMHLSHKIDTKMDIEAKKTAESIQLPTHYEALIQSKIFNRLKEIAGNSKLNTHLLAQALVDMLERSFIKDEKTIKRITLVLDLATKFYQKNYPKFAMALYTVTHELAIQLAVNQNEEKIEQEYQQFLDESKNTVMQSLGLEETDLNNARILSLPACSGTNAFYLAKMLAQKMQSTEKLSAKFVGATYYELSASEFSYFVKDSNTDIFMLSAGPILNPRGLEPGTDLNKFIKAQMITKHRSKPLTLIVDTSSALFKNMRLNAESKRLIQEGKLSIICFESHQKFGQLHTDQAQYGRVFALCSKTNYNSDAFNEILNNSKQDFKKHLDLRIGAMFNYLTKNCLENIKHKHFYSTKVMKKILPYKVNRPFDIYKDTYSLKDLEELYFVVASGDSSFIPTRFSYGHFHTSASSVGYYERIAPNASDTIDAAITATRIYFNSSLFDSILDNYIHRYSLDIREQIILLSLMKKKFSAYENSIGSYTAYCVLFNVIQSCKDLKGRDEYGDLIVRLEEIKQDIFSSIPAKIKNKEVHLKSILSLYNHGIKINNNLTQSLQDNDRISNFIVAVEKYGIPLQFDSVSVKEILSLDQIDKLTQCIQSNYTILRKFKPLDCCTIQALSSHEGALKLAQALQDKGMIMGANNMLILVNEVVHQKMNEYLETNQEITQEQIDVLGILLRANIQVDTNIINLCKNNADFIKLVRLVDSANERVLDHLKEVHSKKKYSLILKESPKKFMQPCIQAITNYANEQTPNAESATRLIGELDTISQLYTNDFLQKNRKLVTKVLEGIKKSFILAISAIIMPHKLSKIYNTRFYQTGSTQILKQDIALLSKTIRRD